MQACGLPRREFYVIEMGRVLMLDQDIRRSIDLFVNDDQMIYIKGRRKTWKKKQS